MKKVFSILLTVLVLFGCTVPAFAATAMKEYKYKGFRIEIPEAMIQDTEWAEKNKYADAWYDKDMNYEIILYEGEYDEYASPLLLEFHNEDGWYICRKYTSEYVYESPVSSHGVDTVVIDGKNIEFWKMEINRDCEDQADHFHYMFPVGKRIYHLMFFIYDSDYIYTAREIAKTVRVSKRIGDVMPDMEFWLRVLMIMALGVVIRKVKEWRTKKKEENIV